MTPFHAAILPDGRSFFGLLSADCKIEQTDILRREGRERGGGARHAPRPTGSAASQRLTSCRQRERGRGGVRVCVCVCVHVIKAESAD